MSTEITADRLQVAVCAIIDGNFKNWYWLLRVADTIWLADLEIHIGVEVRTRKLYDNTPKETKVFDREAQISTPCAVR